MAETTVKGLRLLLRKRRRWPHFYRKETGSNSTKRRLDRDYNKYRKIFDIFQGDNRKVGFIKEKYGPGMHVSHNPQNRWSARLTKFDRILGELS